MEFVLRPWVTEDAPSLAERGSDPAIAENMTDAFPSPYTLNHARAFIERANAAEPPRILAVEVEGRAAGGIGLHPQEDIHRMNAELGYWLARPYWGRGVMTRAIRQMVAYGFEHLDINRIFARPFGTNIGSQRALERAGFKLEATLASTILKNGARLDELIYAVRRPG